MAEFPAAPIAPERFFGEWLPAAFAEAGPLPEAEGADLAVGFCLEGAGGGAWLCRLQRGAFSVHPAGALDCGQSAVTYIQRVADWQAALWAGQGGALGAAAARLFRAAAALPSAGAVAHGESSAASAAADFAGQADGGGAAWLLALEKLRKLDGLVRLAIAGGGAAGGDWELALRLGPGPIPGRATCTLRASAATADALARGELAPMAAFLRGQIEVQGGIKLLLRLAAVLRSG